MSNGTLAQDLPSDSGPAAYLLALVSNGSGGYDLKKIPPSDAYPSAANDAGWTNVGAPITTDRLVVDGDHGKTIYSTANVGTITFDAATDYASTEHATRLYNGTARGWKVDVDGEIFPLWPKQTAEVYRVGNAWAIRRPELWRSPVGGITFYVNHSSGSDTNNDGLTSGSAFATIQKAIRTIEFDVWCAGYGATVQVLDASFAEDTVSHTYRIGGYHVIYLVGNAASPTSCVWNVGQAGVGRVGLTCRDWSGIIVDGFQFVALNNGCTATSTSQHGITDIWRCNFNTFAAGIHIESTNGGSVGYVVGATITISGSAAYHWNVAGANLLCTGVTIVVNSALSMTCFVQGLLNAVMILAGISFTGGGAGSGTTGLKYILATGAQLSLNGTTLPGATAGSASATSYAYAA